jgi:hypothetical protein
MLHAAVSCPPFHQGTPTTMMAIVYFTAAVDQAPWRP